MRAKRKTAKKRTGNFLSKVVRSAKVKRVRAKIRKADAARKKLSAEYKRTVKEVARKLKRKR